MAPTDTRLAPSDLPTDPYLDRLTHLVAQHGIAEFEGDIARLVVRLRAAGHGGWVVDLLADHTAPAVARERALGHAVGILRRPAPTSRCAVRTAA